MQKRQIPLFFQKNTTRCGGSHVRSHLKTKRPLNPKLAIHLVLRAAHARGKSSMFHRSHRQRIDNLIIRQAKHFGLKIYKYANVGNHLHLVAQTPSRESFNAFIRTITGLIARIISQRERGPAKARMSQSNTRQTNSFWEGRPFTRQVQVGRDFNTVIRYVEKNILQSLQGRIVSLLWLTTSHYVQGTG